MIYVLKNSSFKSSRMFKIDTVLHMETLQAMRIMRMSGYSKATSAE